MQLAARHLLGLGTPLLLCVLWPWPSHGDGSANLLYMISSRLVHLTLRSCSWRVGSVRLP